MPKIQQRDFYFGAALSMFFKHNKDTRPSIIEAIENSSQIMKMTTNTSDDFYVFMKYTADKKLLRNDKKKSWTFPLTEKDKTIIAKYHSDKVPLYLFFICGYNEEYKTGEIAVLTYDEYEKINHKQSVTITIAKSGDKHFNVHIGKAQEQTFPVATNRIEKKITDI